MPSACRAWSAPRDAAVLASRATDRLRPRAGSAESLPVCVAPSRQSARRGAPPQPSPAAERQDAALEATARLLALCEPAERARQGSAGRPNIRRSLDQLQAFDFRLGAMPVRAIVALLDALAQVAADLVELTAFADRDRARSRKRDRQILD